MKNLFDCKDDIHSCSKCGLCQSVCPMYKITGNDCTVSRGHFIMLNGLIKGELKMSKTINKYLDLCLKCDACSKFCPSGINVVDIISLAKQEFYKKSRIEKFVSFLLKEFVFGFLLDFLALFKNKSKSKKFDKKVVYFGGCGSKINGNKAVVKILNACGIEVLSPNFGCCGFPFLARGDMENFQNYYEKFCKELDKIGITEIVTTCASCEKVLKSYSKFFQNNKLKVKNIFEYIRENNLQLELNKKTKVTFHKPCHIENYEDILWILTNTKNLEYIQMQDYDLCCGFNGITKLKHFFTMLNLYKKKRKNIMSTRVHLVLTSCLGCEVALKICSLGKYKVDDFTRFLAKNICDK